MTEQQKKLIEPILATITNEDIRNFAFILMNDLPQYIWEVPASSTGKYHPQYSLGQGGLMRHQIAVVRFLNFFFELEQYQTVFTDREMDLMRIAGLIHDGRKSGSQADYERSKYTKFDHPIQMADVVRTFTGKYLSEAEIEFIANCIESHMGQFNTDRKSSVVLPKPTNTYQQLIHLADYLASRKSLTMDFDMPTVTLPNVDEYKINFGKYKGQKLVAVFEKDRDYLQWCKENIGRETLVSLISILEKRVESDEI